MEQENRLDAKKAQFVQRESSSSPFDVSSVEGGCTSSRERDEGSNQSPGEYSNAQAPWRLVLLSIITFTLYDFYWFYRNWKHLKIHKKLDIRPGWRTVGLLFVPIYNVFLIYRQFRDIRDFAKQTGCETFASPGWLTLGYVCLSTVSTRLSFAEWKTTDPGVKLAITVFGLLIDLLGVWILVVVQNTLNRFWQKEQPHLEMRSKFTGKEIALIVVGGIFWILSLIGAFFPE